MLWVGLGHPSGIWMAAEPATRVTTDTSDYCVQLRLMVEDVVRHATIPPPWGVATLTEEGQRMCDDGQIRGGITRLRRALMMLRKAEGLRGG